MRALWLTLGLTLVFPGTALAHDLWVEPEAFRVRSGAKVPVRLKIGSKKDVKAVVLEPDRILRLDGVTGKETRPIVGEAGRDPVGTFDTTGLQGDVLLAYRSNHAYIELEAADFEAYLEHEGLSGIIELRKQRGESEATGKESYARSCKALLTVGSPGNDWGRVLNLPLKIVPLVDPRLEVETLRFSVLAEGEPVAKARVDLMPLDDLERSVPATTDAKGVVELPAPEKGGRYMVAVTHMTPAKAPLKGTWASQWATFAFQIERP